MNACLQSETFFKDVPVDDGHVASEVHGVAANHEFLQRHIMSHTIWQSQQFWEEAFYRQVFIRIGVLILRNFPNSSVCMRENDWHCRNRGTHATLAQKGDLAVVTRVRQCQSFLRMLLLQ